MPRPTITSRQLKNKDSGLDLFVPEFREVKGVLQSTVFYQVVLVTNLGCFKTPSHKETDVVQYSIEKKLSDFEELLKKISAQFPGTVLPAINKKSIIVNPTVLRDRRNSLDHLAKFFASVAKIATCAPLLEFLGVDSVRAKKFSKGEPLEDLAPADISHGIDDTDQDVDVDFAEEEEGAGGDEDIFGDSSAMGSDEGALFGADSVQMFDKPDLKPDLSEEDEMALTFVPNAIITRTEIVREEGEDNSDLFRIEDDLDQLMVTKPDATEKAKSADTEKATSADTEKAKPAIKAKPKLPAKPKLGSSKQTEKTDSPGVATPKPKSASETGAKAKNQLDTSEGESVTLGADTLGQDGIMKYLQDNLEANQDDVDLFS